MFKLKNLFKVVFVAVFIPIFLVACANGADSENNGQPRVKPRYPAKMGISSDVSGKSYALDLDSTGLFTKIKGISDIQTGVALPQVYTDYRGEVSTGIKIESDMSGGTVFYTEIIDLNEQTGNLISFESYYDDFSKINRIDVSLVDIYDSSREVGICWKKGDISYPGISYTLVSCNGAEYGRRNDGSDANYPSGESRPVHGTVNWLNGHYESIVRDLHAPFNFRYDITTNQVFSVVGSAMGQEYMILDVDDIRYMKDSSLLFQGFTTGEVYMKITFTDIAGGGAIVITSIGGKDVTAEQLSPSPSNSIRLQMDMDYYEDNLPDGAVGLYYNLPVPIYSDLLRGEYEIETKLSLSGIDISSLIKDNRFKPNIPGEYLLEYKAKDINNLDITRQYHLTINESATPITIEFEDNTQEQYRLYSNAELPKIQVTGGNGKLSVDARYSHGDMQFLPDASGKYYIDSPGVITIFVEVTDELGNTAVQEKECEITGGTYIWTDSYIPSGIKKASTFTVPDFNAVDYSDSMDGREMEKSTYVNGELLTATDRKITIPGSGTVEIEFYGDKGTADEIKKVFLMHVIDPAEIVDISGYFTAISSQAENTDNGVLYTANGESNCLMLANAVSANYLQINVGAVSSATNYRYIEIMLEDSLDPTLQAAFRIYKDAGGALLKTRGKDGTFSEQLRLSANVESGDDFIFFFENLSGYLYDIHNNKIAKILFDEAGNALRAFPSNAVKISFSIGGIQGEGDKSQILIKNIGNQDFRNISYRNGDTVAPQIATKKEIGDERCGIGTTITMYAAKAYDVLQFESTIVMTLTDPDGNVIFDKMACDTDIDYTFDKCGVYSLTHTLEDSTGRKTNKVAFITVIDDIAPVISVSGTYDDEYYCGQTITLNAMTVTDNLDGKVDLTVYVMVVDTELNYHLMQSGQQFKFTKQGTYKVIHYACDQAGNTATVIYEMYAY